MPSVAGMELPWVLLRPWANIENFEMPEVAKLLISMALIPT